MSDSESEGKSSRGSSYVDRRRSDSSESDDKDEAKISEMKGALRSAVFLDMEQYQELEIARERLLKNTTVFESMIRYCWEGALENLQKLTESQFKELAVECVNNLDSNGMAPIHYAARFNKFSCLKTLIDDLGANPHLVDGKLGANALIHAAKSTEKTVATSKVLILPKGFKWYQMEGEEEAMRPTPLPVKKANIAHPYAMMIELPIRECKNMENIVDYAKGLKKNLEHIKSEMKMMQEIGACFHAVVRYLIDLGLDPNALDDVKESALSYAAARGNFRIIQELLVRQEIDPNERLYDKGTTYLHLAAKNGHHEAVLLFLAFGGDPKLLDNNGTDAVI